MWQNIKGQQMVKILYIYIYSPNRKEAVYESLTEIVFKLNQSQFKQIEMIKCKFIDHILNNNQLAQNLMCIKNINNMQFNN